MMSRNLRRMLLAMVVTCLCLAATEYWYISGAPANHLSDGKPPVARLNESSNEVQRKEAKRIIWESVGRNDDLFNGEAVRTTPKANANIVLLKTGTVIHLDPDSLIVLEENDNGLALNFLQGNLFVQSGTTDGTESNSKSEITLKTGSGEVKLGSASDLSLSKDKSGKVNLEVFKGKAELEQNGKKISVEKDKTATISAEGITENKDRLALLSPLAGETIFLNLLRGEKLNLNFKPVDPDYSVTIELGHSRNALKPLGEISAMGNTGKLSLNLKPGRWYLRLRASSVNNNRPQLISMTLPFRVEPKAPPTLIEPKADAPLIQDPEKEVEFQWLNRNRFESQIFELAKDANFKTIVAKEDQFETGATSIRLKVAEGQYYWRVTGYLHNHGKLEGLSSAARSLLLVSHLEIKAAALVLPKNHSRISLLQADRAGITLKWQPVLGVNQFRVLAQQKTKEGIKTVFDQTTQSNILKLTGLKSGEVTWKVTSMKGPDEAGPVSEAFDFTIDAQAKLEWANPKPQVEYLYSTPTPSLQAQWQALPEASFYRYRLSKVDKDIESATWTSVKQDHLDVSLEDEGQYNCVVQALDAQNQTLAESDIKEFTVKRQPLLPPPQWTQATPRTLKTDAKGNLSFGWEQVDGAKGYLFILENAEGKPVEQKTVTRTTASVKRLKPGQYRVKLKSVDQFERPSQEGEVKALEVPVLSDIKAPKIKAMKVN